MIYILSVIIILFFLLGCTSPKDSVPIRIGFISPLSTDAAVIGVQQMNAVKLAVAEINREGGVNGRPLDIIYEDSKCDSKEAVNAVNKLINIDKVSIVLGDICSGAVMATKPILESNKVVTFTWGSNPDITKDSEYLFRNSPSDEVAGKELAEYIYQQKRIKSLAILTLNADFTNAFLIPFKSRFKELGGEVLSEEINLPATTDFRTSIIKIKEKDPEVIFILGTQPENTGLMVKQLREQGLSQQIYSAYAFSSPAAVDAAGKENAKGIIYIDAPQLDKTNSISATFLNNYYQQYGEKPKGSEFYAAAAYDSVYIIKGALAKCGEDNLCIKTNLQNVQFSGALGKYSIDSDGNVVGVKYSIRQVE